MAVPEAIVICVDDSRWMSSPKMFQAQYDAIEHYCKLKFREHPDTVVGLHTLGSDPFHLLYPPTRDLTLILDSVRGRSFRQGVLDLSRGLSFSRIPLQHWVDSPDNKTQTRILLFVGGLTNMSEYKAEAFGQELSEMGVAVDIVNFYQGETPEEDREMIVEGYYQYGKSVLCEFFKFCNDKSHFLDVKPELSICQQISETMFKKTPQSLSEKQNDTVEEFEPSLKRSRLSEKQNDNVEELEPSYVNVEELGLSCKGSCLSEKQNDNDEEMKSFEESGWVNVIDAKWWSPC